MKELARVVQPLSEAVDSPEALSLDVGKILRFHTDSVWVERFFKEFEERYYNSWNPILSSHVKSGQERGKWRVKSIIPPKFGFDRIPIQYLDEDFFDTEKLLRHQEEILESLFPNHKEICEKLVDFSGIYERLNTTLRHLYEYLGIFCINTPQISYWQVKKDEVVPVVLENPSVLFFKGGQRVEAFHQTSHEIGESKSINYNIRTRPLNEDRANYFLGRLFESIIVLKEEMHSYEHVLSAFHDGEIETPRVLEQATLAVNDILKDFYLTAVKDPNNPELAECAYGLNSTLALFLTYFKPITQGIEKLVSAFHERYQLPLFSLGEDQITIKDILTKFKYSFIEEGFYGPCFASKRVPQLPAPQ